MLPPGPQHKGAATTGCPPKSREIAPASKGGGGREPETAARRRGGPLRARGVIEIELWSIYRWLMQRTDDALLTG